MIKGDKMSGKMVCNLLWEQEIIHIAEEEIETLTEEQRKEVLSAQEKKKTLMDVYGEQDLERLIQKIVSQKNASVISCETIRNEIEQKKRKYKVLEEGRFRSGSIPDNGFS